MKKYNNDKNFVYSIVAAISFVILLTFHYLSNLRLIFDGWQYFFGVCAVISCFFFVHFAIKNSKQNKEQKTKKIKNIRTPFIISAIILSICYIVFVGMSKYYYCFGKVDAEQIYYHMFVGSDKMDMSTVYLIALPCILLGTIATVTIFYILNSVYKKVQLNEKKKSGIPMVCSLVSIILTFTYILYLIPIIPFVYNQNCSNSNFIEQNYIDPLYTEIEFPEEKRNLIYIYMESMENTFSDFENGGAFENNLIPEITQLQKENFSFSNTDKFGGALSTYGMTYTTAGIFAQSFGLPLKIGNKINGKATKILSEFYNIYDVLSDAGYSEYVIMGSSSKFGGLKELFDSHGSTKVLDYQYMTESGFVDENYRVFWGVEDEKVYELSKEKISEISKNKEPFFFTIETVDTHCPNGYVCNLCKNTYQDDYSNVINCASKQVNDFIKWAEEQEWYENTTIVIVGDHCSMKTDFFADIDKNYVRTTTNIFINVDPSIAKETVKLKNRQFFSADMFPTTLASIGCKIDGNRLGVGTNLFSDRATLYEEFGYEFVNNEFKKKSTLYETVFS